MASTIEVQVVNPDGLHIRPAGIIAKAMADFDARVAIANLRTGAPARDIVGPVAVMLLDARCGDLLAVSAEGTQAQDAVEALAALVRGGFGDQGVSVHP